MFEKGNSIELFPLRCSRNSVNSYSPIIDKVEMSRITVDASRQGEVEELYHQWGKNLPRVPGQLGGTITNWIVGQRIGDDIELFFDEGFLPTLRESNIAFGEG